MNRGNKDMKEQIVNLFREILSDDGYKGDFHISDETFDMFCNWFEEDLNLILKSSSGAKYLTLK